MFMSGERNLWRLRREAPEKFFRQWPEYSSLAAQLFYNRKLLTQKSVDEFFNPDYSEDLHDPFLLKGMDKLMGRLKEGLKNNEKIIIYGDYDADGVCGTVILETLLRQAGFKNVSVYIPDRAKEGYGLNEKAVKEIIKKKIRLVITVDCGITDYNETEMFNRAGVAVAIIDHHLPLNRLPRADVIVDPWQKGDGYPFKKLSGAGVVFKVVQAAMKKFPLFPLGFDKWLLDLVAISTIADCMPLLGENRTLVKYGLVVLAQTRRVGLKALMSISRIKPEFDHSSLSTNLDTSKVAFSIVPRLNAASRMDHANTSYRLLKCENDLKAQELAKKLDIFNRGRQKKVEDIILEAERRYAKSGGEVIFEGDNNWPNGLLGLIAGKLKDKFYRPAFIYNIGDKEVRGSARGLAEFNVVEAMEKCSLTVSGFGEFGGHALAGGFSIKPWSAGDFKSCLVDMARREFAGKKLAPAIEIDKCLSPEEISWQNLEIIENFAPFGPENSEPVFLLKGARIIEARAVGSKNRHLRMTVEVGQEQKRLKAIGFKMGDFADQLSAGDVLNIVFYMEVDTWNGHKEMQLNLIDFKKV